MLSFDSSSSTLCTRTLRFAPRGEAVAPGSLLGRRVPQFAVRRARKRPGVVFIYGLRLSVIMRVGDFEFLPREFLAGGLEAVYF